MHLNSFLPRKLIPKCFHQLFYCKRIINGAPVGFKIIFYKYTKLELCNFLLLMSFQQMHFQLMGIEWLVVTVVRWTGNNVWIRNGNQFSFIIGIFFYFHLCCWVCHVRGQAFYRRIRRSNWQQMIDTRRLSWTNWIWSPTNQCSKVHFIFWCVLNNTSCPGNCNIRILLFWHFK